MKVNKASFINAVQLIGKAALSVSTFQDKVTNQAGYKLTAFPEGLLIEAPSYKSLVPYSNVIQLDLSLDKADL